MPWNLDALVQIKSANHEPFTADQGSTNETGSHLHSGGICISIEQSLFISFEYSQLNAVPFTGFLILLNKATLSLDWISFVLHKGYIRFDLENSESFAVISHLNSFLEKMVASGRAIPGQSKMVQII